MMTRRSMSVVAGAVPVAVLAVPVLLAVVPVTAGSAAARPEASTISDPLVPFSTIVDHWDHHWFLWLPHHPVYEAVEIASRDPDPDGRVAVWIWFTERTGAKHQIHYRNDRALAGLVGGEYRPIDFTISGDVGRPRGVAVRFDDVENRPVAIDVAFDPAQTLSRQGAGLTDQSGHMSDRGFLVFYRATNALAPDARVLIGANNVTFDREQPAGGFPFKWAYSHDITIGVIRYGPFNAGFGPDRFHPSSQAGGYVMQTPGGGSVSLITDPQGRLREYVDHGAGGAFLRVAFDPPLPSCGGGDQVRTSAFSVSIAAAADILKGTVEATCGGRVLVLVWRPSEPDWARKQPFRSELSRADDHSLSGAVTPVR